MSFAEKIKAKMSKSTVNTTRKTLEKEIYDAGFIPNVITGLIIIIYVCVTTKIPYGQLPTILVTALLTIAILELIIAPITNQLITQNISDDLDSFYNYETSIKERTKLMKQLMSCPAKIGLEVFFVTIIGSCLWLALCHRLCKLDNESVILTGTSILFGAYAGAVLAINQTQKVCSGHACKVVEAGVFRKEIDEKHYFGIRSTIITVIHIFGPLLLINGFFALLTWRSCVVYTSAKILIPRIIIISVCSSIFYTFLSSMLFIRMMRSINKMRSILEVMDSENLHKVHHTPTDLSNEFMYNVYLINTILELLQKILRTSQDISMEVVESSNELSVISKETAVTSLEQSSGIKELLTAMEESDSLSKNISEKISEVSLVARKTTDDINEGFEILKENMQKLDEIKQANEVTVEGIKILSEKISGISDIAGIINSIADQTNIIAFNAELEASRAGLAGENFKLVANEIRRLTNNTIQSTNEIRKRIVEIQHSSENLLLSSQSGSKQILAGNKIINELHDSFEDLKISSETTDTASSEIKRIIEQQTVSFEQIVITLRQIAQAAESFSESTQSISHSAENLCVVSDKLKKLQILTEKQAE